MNPQSKSCLKSLFKKIHSFYIIKKIYANLTIEKKLNIIKYNKSIQKRINIDYIEYCKSYSPIEITIIFSGAKHGQFINFDETTEKYFHIYAGDKEYEKKMDLPMK